MVVFNVAGETMFLYMLRRDEESTTSINIVFNVENEEREILAKLAFEHPTQCVLPSQSRKLRLRIDEIDREVYARSTTRGGRRD